MLLQEVAALQEEVLGAQASAASAQAASRLAERQAMRTRSERQAEAQTAELGQVRPCFCKCNPGCLELQLQAPVMESTLQAIWLQLSVRLPAELCNASRA